MSLPILTYHAVGDQASPVFTPIRAFESHLDALTRAGYTSITSADMVLWLHGGTLTVEKPILITFDDGYASVADAWDRLQAHGVGAMVFLITDYVGKDNRWRGQPATIPTAPLLDWTQIERMAADGCEFAAHTRAHPPLTALAPAQVEDEMREAADIIRARIGQVARVFCYPYGAENAAVRSAAASYFDAAFGTRLGIVDQADDRYRLARVDSYYLTPTLIAGLDRPPARAYLDGRDLLRRIKRLVKPDFHADDFR